MAIDQATDTGHAPATNAAHQEEIALRWLWNERHEIIERARLSVLYHRRRERFFDGCDRTAKAAAIIGASAAWSNALGAEVIRWVAFAITVTSVASLLFDFGGKARRHCELASQFRILEADIERVGKRDFTEAELNQWAARIGTIESGEPASLRNLAIACANELAIASGEYASVTPLSWHARLSKQFL